MEQLPKVVAQRLQAVSADSHPDANLLAAFAEKSLLSRERAQIMEHLAVCAGCREITAFMQPQNLIGPAEIAAARAKRSWFHAAEFRWAALAACVVIVGTVVISRSSFEKKSSSPTAMLKAPAIVAENEAQPALSSPALEESRSKTVDKIAGLKPHAAMTAKRDTDEPNELDKKQSAQALQNGLPAANQEGAKREFESRNIPARAESVTVTSAPVVISDEAKASKKEFSTDKSMKLATANNEFALAPSPPPPPPTSKPMSDSSAATQAKTEAAPAIDSFYKAKDGYVAGESGAAGRLSSQARSPAARWQLSAEGKLVKSLDLGRSWLPVSLADNVIFRALCVTDREVWVGGTNGTLFYSANAGQSWEQVKPSTNGKNLIGDIIAVTFADPLHGKVSTTNHETWTTTDGGHVWQVESR